MRGRSPQRGPGQFEAIGALIAGALLAAVDAAVFARCAGGCRTRVVPVRQFFLPRGAGRQHLSACCAAAPPHRTRRRVARTCPRPLAGAGALLAGHHRGRCCFGDDRLGRHPLVDRPSPKPQQAFGAGEGGLADGRDVHDLAVRHPTPGRLTLGLHGRQLLAAEPQTSLAVVGPTGCGKTVGFAIPALLEWNGPIIATSVKTDLLDATLAHRSSVGTTWVYDPARCTGLIAREVVTVVGMHRLGRRHPRRRVALRGSAAKVRQRHRRRLLVQPGTQGNRPVSVRRGRHRPNDDRRGSIGGRPKPARSRKRSSTSSASIRHSPNSPRPADVISCDRPTQTK